MTRRATLSALALCLAATAQAHPGAQQFVLSSQDRARLLALDFVAVFVDGRPVTDLRADEVTLRIDGRTRPIRSLEYIPVSRRAENGAELPAAPYGSNTVEEGTRSVVLIVDQETLRAGREAPLKEQIATFVRGLGDRDRVALMTVPFGGLKVDLTSEHHRISQALASIGGQAPSTESTDDASCRTSATLAALRGTLDDLRGGEGPVTVILFSGQMSPPFGVFAAPTPSAAMQTLARCQIRPEQFRQVGAAAAAARAQFYIIQPELSVTPEMRAGLEHLAGVTGGLVQPLGGGDRSALARVTRETAGYYIARVEPDPSEAAGSVRQADITVARPNVVTRHRPQMSVTRPIARFVNAKAAAPLDMMKQAAVFRDLPLRVSGYASREEGADRVRIITVFDSPDPSAVFANAMIGLFDGQGRLVASRQLEGAELVGAPVVSALAVPPGVYRLRVAATEANSRGGTADYTVSADLAPAGSLVMSDLVVGLSRGGQFSPRLEFGAEASAVAQVEVYGGAAGDAVGAVFELARTANGPALATTRGVFSATSHPNRFVVTATIPIGALTAGDYVVRATVAAEGKAGGRVVRALRKVTR